MWLTAVDIASTWGGHAGMQRSQPLQCPTSIVTVPRLLMLTVLTVVSDICRLPGRELAGGQEEGSGAERSLVRFDVLGAIRRDRGAHGRDQSVLGDDASGGAEGTEHHHRSGKRAAEIGGDSRRGDAMHDDVGAHLTSERRIVHEHEPTGT